MMKHHEAVEVGVQRVINHRARSLSPLDVSRLEAAIAAIKDYKLLQGCIIEYMQAREAYEAATKRPNSHAPEPQLKHGDPIVIRLRDARMKLMQAMAE